MKRSMPSLILLVFPPSSFWVGESRNPPTDRATADYARKCRANPPYLGHCALLDIPSGDATVLSIREGRFDYVDVVGEHLEGDRRIVSEGVVVAGRWWHPRPM
jgi:hypothetical protein